jgi:alpha-tubulin suppressor-like RCC1 family protein
MRLHQSRAASPIRDYRPATVVRKGAWMACLLFASLVFVPGRATAQPAPDAAPPGLEGGTADWRQVTTGGAHSCGIRTNGRLYCWGSDQDGQLGDGGAHTDRPSPTEVAGGATNWASVSAGGHNTCARKTNGRLFCWGSDESGELGDGGANTERQIPTEVAGGATNWASVTVANSFACALKTNGRLFCWGSDVYGQLGDGGANTLRSVPTQVAGGATNWAAVSADGNHTCARKTNRRLYCWGDDEFGALGNGGANTNRSVPTQVTGGATDWAAFSAGHFHTCARKTNGRLYCWGYDLSGQLGDGGANTNRPIPTQVAGGATDWAAVTAGLTHTCARKTNGRLYCWGGDSFGQLGDGGTNTGRPTPTEVAGGATDWAGVSAGDGHTCARKTSRLLYCWGADFVGQLGNGPPNADQASPAQVV